VVTLIISVTVGNINLKLGYNPNKDDGYIFALLTGTVRDVS
jgi:hypothetical protein